MYVIYDDELMHHGIKGQKWGIRRTAAQLGHVNNHGKSDDYKQAHSRKSVKSMSDTELRSRLNRLNMEKQYKELADTNMNRAKRFIKRMGKTGITVAGVTGTTLTIYNNTKKISKILGML